MAHKDSYASCLEEESIAWHPLQGFGVGEHNLSIVGGNWEGIIGDGMSR